MKEHYSRGGLGDVKVKKFLNRVLEEELRPIRERRKKWEQDIPAVYEILKSGSEKAERVAAQTLKEILVIRPELCKVLVLAECIEICEDGISFHLSRIADF